MVVSAGATLGDKHYVAVEGVIGVGKTSLVQRLAGYLGACMVLEEVEENPFLPRFYRDPERWAFQVQLFFLLSRYRQQQAIRQVDLFSEVVISDYMFAKDRIFARLNLDTEELALYDRVAEVLEKTAAIPDLVVYLQARTDVLMQRIRERGRPFEKRIHRDYIEALNEAYHQFFHTYRASPVLIVDANRVDFRSDDAMLEELIARMARLRTGVEVWVPGEGSA